jgi:predicted membrane protein DUF2339
MEKKDHAGPRSLPADELREAIARLEHRVSRLETRLEMREVPNLDGPAVAAEPPPEPGGLEFRIGEVYLSQVGIVALLIGMGFLAAYLYTILPPAPASLGAYLLTGLAFLFAWLLRARSPRLIKALAAGGLLLLYFATVRLHFFGSRPLVASPGAGLVLAALAVAAQAAISIRLRSQFLGAVTLACGCATGLIADGTHLTLCALLATSALAAVLRLRQGWDQAAVFAVFVVYAAHLEWLIGNPLLDHPVKLRADGLARLGYLFGYAILFAGANLFRSRKLAYEWSNIILSFFNAAGFYLICLLVTFTYPREEMAALNLTASLFLLGEALAYWLMRRSFYSASFYAMTGFFALSVAIIARFDAPPRFALLTWQAVLVILTGIWFRSRIITLGNLFIFLGVYCFYRFSEPTSPWVELNYAAVSILSVKLLGAHQGAMDYKTEVIRNAYLVTTFFVLPYGLYLAVPSPMVSVSWLGTSLLYFTLSFILRNRKFRWMGILNFLLVLGRVFLVDLSRLDLIYRIVSFLALGTVLLGVSVAYGRRSRGRRPIEAKAPLAGSGEGIVGGGNYTTPR